MRFSLFINQAKAMEWGLNVQQAILFSYLHDLPTWGKYTVINGEAFWWSGKDKVICELPILTDKPDTVKRHMAALEKAGLIERITHQNRPLVRITDKGKQWNKHEGGGENNPDQGGKNIPTRSGEKSPLGREKNPAYKNTSDQSTKISKEKSKPKKPELDFSCWPSPPSDQVFRDWKIMRDKKRAPITQTVINRLASKLFEAHQRLGMSVDDVLGLCAERGWQGFEVDWIERLVLIAPTMAEPNSPPKKPPRLDRWPKLSPSERFRQQLIEQGKKPTF
ncbi:hypothetical protein [Vibrio metschnikovii]|uniref:hypothetical protein n=1 Tax=Vibrio metschnikovii TaxID=28172 RepID=UPI002FC9C929